MEKPKRNPHPFPFVKEQIVSTVEGMLINLEQTLSWLRDEDVKRISELMEILKSGYDRAKNLIKEEKKR